MLLPPSSALQNLFGVLMQTNSKVTDLLPAQEAAGDLGADGEPGAGLEADAPS